MCVCYIIFLYVHSVSPSVRGDVGIVVVTEGNDIAISLEILGAKTPFPPVVTSVWTFKERNLTHSSSIMLNDFNFNITLERISRNMTGNYTLIVSNSAGSISGSFEVDVQCRLLTMVYYIFTIQNL